METVFGKISTGVQSLRLQPEQMRKGTAGTVHPGSPRSVTLPREAPPPPPPPPPPRLQGQSQGSS